MAARRVEDDVDVFPVALVVVAIEHGRRRRIVGEASNARNDRQVIEGIEEPVLDGGEPVGQRPTGLFGRRRRVRDVGVQLRARLRVRVDVEGPRRGDVIGDAVARREGQELLLRVRNRGRIDEITPRLPDHAGGPPTWALRRSHARRTGTCRPIRSAATKRPGRIPANCDRREPPRAWADSVRLASPMVLPSPGWASIACSRAGGGAAALDLQIPRPARTKGAPSGPDRWRRWIVATTAGAGRTPGSTPRRKRWACT